MEVEYEFCALHEAQTPKLIEGVAERSAEKNSRSVRGGEEEEVGENCIA
jgi:hypothetical protein